MRYQGRLIEWNDERGFGFIEPNGGGERVFLHIKAVRGVAARPAVGQVFNYTLGKDDRGRPRAIVAETLQLNARRRQAENRRGNSAWRLEAGLAGLAAQVALVLLLGLPVALIAVLAALNLVTFFLYWLDKRAAQAEGQRTPENSLHLAALLGGWPAALMAQRLLRHKSLKQPFQTIFWLTVMMNSFMLLWLGSAMGRALLQEVF
jgi:uncharacterized membrane protein YsdA (DUF1294 family)/cold shock CspA family protein